MRTIVQYVGGGEKEGGKTCFHTIQEKKGLFLWLAEGGLKQI